MYINRLQQTSKPGPVLPGLHAFMNLRPMLMLCMFLLIAACTACSAPAEDGRQEDAVAATATSATGEATDTVMITATPVLPDTTVVRIFEALMAEAKRGDWAAAPLGEVMTNVGQWFGGKPYVAGTLDLPAYEQLVVKLDGFDCVTFVESVLALARTIDQESYSLSEFTENLRAQRYRGGTMDGYCSRLHYFSDWILDNEARGNVRNITQDIGGEPLDKELDFMSEHRESYPHLVQDSLFAGILEMEARLRDFQMYYIPQGYISKAYPSLQAGDIIALATDIEGLDVSHTGMVFKHEDGSAGLLHASTANGVIVSPDLQAYVENNRRQIGIVVARPLEHANAD